MASKRTKEKLDDNGKVHVILHLLLERARQCGLTDEIHKALIFGLDPLLSDNSEGINTTLLEAIQIVLKR